MSVNPDKIFFSPEIASSIGLEEAIIFSVIENYSLGLNEKELIKKLNFLQQEKVNAALSKLLILKLIENKNSEFLNKSLNKFTREPQKLSFRPRNGRTLDFLASGMHFLRLAFKNESFYFSPRLWFEKN